MVLIIFFLLFCQLLYFDRINNTTYPDRTTPTFKAWNNSLLRDRQSQEMNSIKFGSGNLMPVFTGQNKHHANSQENEEEHVNDHIVDDEACNDNAADNADKERDNECSDHDVSKHRAGKRKAQASDSSTESGESVLSEVTSTLYLTGNLTM